MLSQKELKEAIMEECRKNGKCETCIFNMDLETWLKAPKGTEKFLCRKV